MDMIYEKMKKACCIGVALIGIGIALQGCTGDAADVVADQTLGHCLTSAVDTQTKAQIYSRMSFGTLFNYSNNTMDMALTGLVLPIVGNSNGQGLPKMTVRALPWVFDRYGWKVVEADNVVPEITGMSDVPVFSKFKFRLLDVVKDEKYLPGIIYDFTLKNGQSDVRVMGCCMDGKTVSTNPAGVAYIPEEDENVREKLRPAYWVDFDFAAMTADIYLFNAKFLDRMPTLNLVFPSIPFTVSGSEMTLESAALTPEYDGVPNTGFPISQLKATVNFEDGMTLDFHCNFRGADYTVNFTGKY